MKWPTVDQLTDLAPLPSGYSYAFPTRAETVQIIRALEQWYPGIAVGNASCHMRESFYASRVYLGDDDERDFLVTLLKCQGELAAIFSVERDVDSRVIYGRIGAIAPEHRGAHLSRALLARKAGRSIDGDGSWTGNAGNHPATFERMGWQLIGIMPGFDQELVAPGEVQVARP
jgi:hypothetical protein